MIETKEIIKCNACKKHLTSDEHVSLIGNIHWHNHEYHEGIYIRYGNDKSDVLVEKNMHFCDFDCWKDYVTVQGKKK